MRHSSKITVIIGTATAPFEFFVQAILSLIIRTKIESLDQIIVSINGPDSRTGDDTLQTRKEQFAKELDDLGYPVTVVRTWSRLDSSRPFQMCLPLVRTKYYLLMQDDLIVTNPGWLDDALDLFEKKKCSIVMSGQSIDRRLQAHEPNENLSVIDFWQMNMSFVMVDATKCSNNWVSYNNIPQAKISDLETFIKYHIQNTNFDWRYSNMFHYPDGKIKVFLDKNLKDHPLVYLGLPKDQVYNFLNMPMGAWVYYLFKYEIETFKPKTIYHFCEASTKADALSDANAPSCELKFLEDEFKDTKLNDIYRKYLPARKVIKIPVVVEIERTGNNEFPLVLISVCVYKKIHVVEKWMKHWYNRFNLYNSKVALVHNFDGDAPDPKDRDRLLELKPDYYVPRFNRGQDIGIFQDLVENRLPYFQPEFDLLFCFADDTFPLHKNFLGVFMDVMKVPNIGLCPPYTFEQTIRSNAFGIKKEFAKKLEFPHDPVINKLHCYKVETQMPQQIVEMGLKVVQLPTAGHNCPLAFRNHQWLVWDDDWLQGDMDEWIGMDY